MNAVRLKLCTEANTLAFYVALIPMYPEFQIYLPLLLLLLQKPSALATSCFHLR